MDNPQIAGHPFIGPAYTLASIILGIIATASNIDLIMRICVGIAAMAASFMAIRYHYFATKEKIATLESLKNKSI